jgi:hypothetical protein
MGTTLQYVQIAKQEANTATRDATTGMTEANKALKGTKRKLKNGPGAAAVEAAHAAKIAHYAAAPLIAKHTAKAAAASASLG